VLLRKDTQKVTFNIMWCLPPPWWSHTRTCK